LNTCFPTHLKMQKLQLQWKQIIHPSCGPKTWPHLSWAIKLLYGFKNDFQIIAFWDVIPCTLTERYQYFEGTCCLFHPQDGDTRFLQTTGTFLSDYSVSHQENNNFHIHCHKNLKCHKYFQSGPPKNNILRN
jgi:hypothetical protein